MAIQRRTNKTFLRLFLGTFLLTISGVSIAHAQDAVGNTPPELRDFRLDPVPREPAPQPTTEEPVAAPATQPLAEPAPAPVVRRPGPSVAEPEPERPAPAPATDTTPDAQTTPEMRPPGPEDTSTPDAALTDNTTTPKTEAVAPSESKGMGSWGVVALLSLFLAAAGGAVFLWRRSRRETSAAAPRPRPTTRPTPAKPANAPTPRPAPPRAPPLAFTPKPTTPAISMAFAPENAVVSFSSLTIKGQLQITNAGAVAAENLMLSAVLISASNEQQHAINHFFQNSDQIAPTLIGPVRSSENFILPLKLGVALNEMQTFSLQNKTLLAPILVAKLFRLAPDGTHEEAARLMCMIGRESTPPQPKMAPLRLDQGPRSFDRLGQRALLS